MSGIFFFEKNDCPIKTNPTVRPMLEYICIRNIKKKILDELSLFDHYETNNININYIFKQFFTNIDTEMIVKHIIESFIKFENTQYPNENKKNTILWFKDRAIPINCSTRCLLVAYIYIKRLPEDIITKKTLNSILVTCVIVAFKFTEDGEFTKLLCPMFGLDKKYILRLEITLCKLLEYKLYVSREEFIEVLLDFIN